MERAERLAELAVSVGANVQHGQPVLIVAEVGHGEIVRAVADAAHRRGAQFVDTELSDPYLLRSRALHGPDEPAAEPAWRAATVRALADAGGALIAIRGP